MVSNVGALFQTLLNVSRDPALKAALPIVLNFINAIVAAGFTQEAIVQNGMAALVQLEAIPGLEAEATKDVATILRVEVETLLAKFAAPATVVAIPAAPAA